MHTGIGILGAVVTMVAACTSGSRSEEDATLPMITDEIIIVENASPAWDQPWALSASPVVRIGDASRGPEYSLYRVSAAVELSDGRLVIVNRGSMELRWYSGTGDYLMSAGRGGQGPGEFLQMNRLLRFPGDSVAVSDFQQRRLIVFGPDGEHVRSVRLGEAPGSAIPISRFADGTYLMAPENYFALGDREPIRVERGSLSVERFSEESRRIEVLASLPGREFMIAPNGSIRPDGSEVIARTFRTFGRNTVVAGNESVWVAADNDRPELHFRDPAGSDVMVVRWAAERRPVERRDLDAVRDQGLARVADAPTRQRVREAWERHPEPHALMPAFASEIFLDGDGKVWLKEYVPPHEEDRNQFVVFDETGIWLGSITLPRGLRVLYIGRHQLIGVNTDELGVEFLVVHELLKS